MIPDSLAAIEARLAQATPGPWSYRAHGFYKTDRGYVDSVGYHVCLVSLQRIDNGGKNREEANGELIAHAPTDLQYLLTRLKAAERVCEAAIKAAQNEWNAESLREILTTWEAAR